MKAVIPLQTILPAKAHVPTPWFSPLRHPTAPTAIQNPAGPSPNAGRFGIVLQRNNDAVQVLQNFKLGILADPDTLISQFTSDAPEETERDVRRLHHMVYETIFSMALNDKVPRIVGGAYSSGRTS